MTLKLAIPSKGRLMDATIDWFAARGITLERTGADREYAAAARGIDGLDLLLLSAAEIPRELAAGRIHLGVTGTDLIRERLATPDTLITPLAELGFGHADLILAVPAAWTDVHTAHDLDAAAAQFRATHGHRLRIATKYHRMTRAWLKEKGVADYQIVDSQGATEGTVAAETAEAIADITTTGETLHANHLRPLDEEPILRSQATLWQSRTAPLDADEQRTLDDLKTRLLER
ncbi:ATP phosphoribosyltransferase [Aestuariibius sp. 2305UL40-4]|uniref:ATP phosphoribosyltransferase n=1 Tax=Aestuariibius violaceus TaxID=3234132 RepID=UPI00345F0DF3